MKSDITKFTLRIDSELMNKFHYVADYNGRSSNRELEILIKKHIHSFEEKNGNISLKDK